MLAKGADLLADVRRQGFKPSAPVVIFLDANLPRPQIYQGMPLDFQICIKPGDKIADLEFWLLADLDLAIHAPAMTDRTRDALRAITNAGPRFAMGYVEGASLLFTWSKAQGWQFETITDE